MCIYICVSDFVCACLRMFFIIENMEIEIRNPPANIVHVFSCGDISLGSSTRRRVKTAACAAGLCLCGNVKMG